MLAFVSLDIPLVKTELLIITEMLTSNVVLLLQVSPRHGLSSLCARFVHSQFQQERRRASKSKYSEHFQTLDLPETASKSSVRQKYIELVKLHHPDTNNQQTDNFNRIDFAYKQLMKKFQEDKLRYGHDSSAE